MSDADTNDVPVRRRGPAQQLTEIADAATRPHKGPNTTELPPFPSGEPDGVVRLVRSPTELIDPPTTQVPSAPQPASGTFEAVEPFDRLARAAEALRVATETLDVDRRPLAAQLVAGIAAGLQQAPTNGPYEFVGAKLVARLLLADAGVGGRFSEDQLGQALILIATEVIAGVDPQRRAMRMLAKDSAEKATQYRKLAAQSAARGEDTRAAMWNERADERESLARELKLGAR